MNKNIKKAVKFIYDRIDNVVTVVTFLAIFGMNIAFNNRMSSLEVRNLAYRGTIDRFVDFKAKSSSPNSLISIEERIASSNNSDPVKIYYNMLTNKLGK